MAIFEGFGGLTREFPGILRGWEDIQSRNTLLEAVQFPSRVATMALGVTGARLSSTGIFALATPGLAGPWTPAQRASPLFRAVSHAFHRHLQGAHAPTPHIPYRQVHVVVSLIEIDLLIDRQVPMRRPLDLLRVYAQRDLL